MSTFSPQAQNGHGGEIHLEQTYQLLKSVQVMGDPDKTYLHAGDASTSAGELFAKPNSIRVFRTSDYNHYIRPPPSLDFQHDESRPRDDSVVSGIVAVNLTKTRRVLGLKVRFVCEARLSFPNSMSLEEHTLFEQVLDLNEGPDGMLIEAGLQRFDWAFVLPPTLAGFDRTTSGRIAHRVEATLIGQPTTSRFSQFFGGSAPRSASPGRMRSPSPMAGSAQPHAGTRSESLAARDRRSSSSNTPRSSSSSTPIRPGASVLSAASSGGGEKWLSGSLTAFKDLWIIPLPTENFEPLPFRCDTRSVISGLGIVPWSLETDQATVGGAVSFKMSIVDPAPNATIWAIRLHVSQTVSLKSPTRPEDPILITPPIRMQMFDKGKLPRDINNAPEPLWRGSLVPGTENRSIDTMTIQKVLRLPDENRLRPSTCPGTDTPIRLSHEFVLQIYFSVANEDGTGKPLSQPGPGHLRKAMLSQKTFFTSCCCTRQNLALPSFEESQGHSAVYIPDTSGCDRCACGLLLDELAERELERFRNDAESEEAALEDDPASMGGSDRGRRRKAEYTSSPTMSPSLSPDGLAPSYDMARSMSGLRLTSANEARGDSRGSG